MHPIVFSDLYGTLGCPGCNGTHLHHERIELVFGEREREEGREDSTFVRIIGVASPGLVSVAHAARNYFDHGRRDAMLVSFSCETCPRKPVLRMLQHKGSTLVEWLPI